MLTINGQEVPVYKNGTFIAYIPVEQGHFPILLTAVSKGKTYQAVRNINVPGRPIEQFLGKARFDENKEYRAKTRYSQKNSLCHVTYVGEDRIRVDYEEPVRAITPGQSVVLYTDDWIAGGGVIE